MKKPIDSAALIVAAKALTEAAAQMKKGTEAAARLKKGTVVNIFDLIREELDTSAEADPHVIAEHIVKQIDDGDLRSVLEQVMVRIVADTIRYQRHPAPKAGRSRKEAAGDEYARWRSQRECVRPGEWRFLLDMTAEEVFLARDVRYGVAIANNAAAEKYHKLGLAMKRAKARAVRDLPATKIEEILG